MEWDRRIKMVNRVKSIVMRMKNPMMNPSDIAPGGLEDDLRLAVFIVVVLGGFRDETDEGQYEEDRDSPSQKLKHCGISEAKYQGGKGQDQNSMPQNKTPNRAPVNANGPPPARDIGQEPLENSQKKSWGRGSIKIA